MIILYHTPFHEARGRSQSSLNYIFFPHHPSLLLFRDFHPPDHESCFKTANIQTYPCFQKTFLPNDTLRSVGSSVNGKVSAIPTGFPILRPSLPSDKCSQLLSEVQGSQVCLGKQSCANVNTGSGMQSSFMVLVLCEILGLISK